MMSKYDDRSQSRNSKTAFLEVREEGMNEDYGARMEGETSASDAK
jgi:hypothetical protein